MKAYVINLDRDRDRMAHITRQGEELGISWVRVAAVDKLDEEIADRAANGRRGLLGFTISAGAIACFESHRKAWRLIVESEEPYGAVFEDDVVCSPDLPRFLSSGDWIPADGDIVKLETFLARATITARPAASIAERKVVRLHGRHLGACAYVISRKAAERLLAASEAFADPVDEFLFNVQSLQFPRLVLYQVDPAPCIQGMLLGLDGEEAHLKSSNDRNPEPEKRRVGGGMRRYLARKGTRLWEKGLLLVGERERRAITFR